MLFRCHATRTQLTLSTHFRVTTKNVKTALDRLRPLQCFPRRANIGLCLLVIPEVGLLEDPTFLMVVKCRSKILHVRANLTLLTGGEVPAFQLLAGTPASMRLSIP